MAAQRGDIVLVSFPFTDLSGVKVRPALIVSAISGPDMTLAFISSRLPATAPPDAYVLQTSDAEFAASGLRQTSVFQMGHLVTLHEGLVTRRIGRAGARTRAATDAALKRALGL